MIEQECEKCGQFPQLEPPFADEQGDRLCRWCWGSLIDGHPALQPGTPMTPFRLAYIKQYSTITASDGSEFSGHRDVARDTVDVIAELERLRDAIRQMGYDPDTWGEDE
jgi:hypothetical protein